MSKHEMTQMEKLARYASAPEQLESALASLSAGNLDLARGEGKWTIRQIAHHIVDADCLTAMIIKAALGNSGCAFEIGWYDPNNAWVEAMNYSDRPVEPGLALFRACHLQVEELLHRIPDAWERFVLFRQGRESEGRRLTVEYLIHSQTSHALHHIEQICETRKAHGI